MTNPYLKRFANKSAHGTKAEKKLAKRLQGRLQPASGALQGAKGDIKFPEVLMECKSTIKESISLQLTWLQKISKEALPIGRTPALTILFSSSDGRPRDFGSWVMIPEKEYRELMDEFRQRAAEQKRPPRLDQVSTAQGTEQAGSESPLHSNGPCIGPDQ